MGMIDRLGTKEGAEVLQGWNNCLSMLPSAIQEEKEKEPSEPHSTGEPLSSALAVKLLR